eukprot:5061502-Amphidinium_carterae.1
MATAPLADATVVLMTEPGLGHGAGSILAKQAAAQLRPGAVFLSLLELPLDSRGQLVYVQRTQVETSWGDQIDVWIYLRTLSFAWPPPLLKREGKASTEQKGDDRWPWLLNVTATAKAEHQR